MYFLAPIPINIDDGEDMQFINTIKNLLQLHKKS